MPAVKNRHDPDHDAAQTASWLKAMLHQPGLKLHHRQAEGSIRNDH